MQNSRCAVAAVASAFQAHHTHSCSASCNASSPIPDCDSPSLLPPPQVSFLHVCHRPVSVTAVLPVGNFQIIIQTDTATAILLMKRGRSLVTKHCAGLSTGPGPHPWKSSKRQHRAQAGDSSSSHEVTDRLVAAVFDPVRAFRVFGVTAGGELVLLMVPSGAAAHACRVSSERGWC
jgi:hypothetical protein